MGVLIFASLRNPDGNGLRNPDGNGNQKRRLKEIEFFLAKLGLSFSRKSKV